MTGKRPFAKGPFPRTPFSKNFWRDCSAETAEQSRFFLTWQRPQKRQRTRRGSRRQGEPAAGYSFRPLKARAGGKNNALFCGAFATQKRAAAAPCPLPFRRKNLWKSVRERTFPERFFPLTHPLTLPLNISTFPAFFRPGRRGSVFYIRRGTRRVFFRSAA